VRARAEAELAAAGYRVEPASSVTAAFAALQGGAPPDAVVLDCFVEGLRPEAVVGAIRSWHGELLIIVWSDVLTEATYATLLAAGATACLPRADAGIELAPLVDKLVATQAERRRLATDPGFAPVRAQDPADERENARHRFSMPVAVKAEGWGEFAICYTSDVSRGGLFVRTATPPPVGAQLRVRVGLPDGRVIELDAEVAHVVAPERVPPGRRAGAGVRFVRRTAEERSALAAMVAMLREVVTPPVRAPIAPPPEEAEAEVAELRARLGALRAQDFFAALGVAPGAPPDVVRAAYLQLAREWHPCRYALAAPAVRAVVDEIALLLRQARDTVGHPERGVEYARRLPRPRRGPRPHAPAPARPAPVAPHAVTARGHAAAALPLAPAAPSAVTALRHEAGAPPLAPAAPRAVTLAGPGPDAPWPETAPATTPGPAPPRWASAGPVAAPQRTSTARETIGRLEGVLHNPQGLAAIAALPLQPDAPLDAAARQSLVCLIRWLARNRASGLLTLQAAHPVTIALLRGRVSLGERDTAWAVQAAGAPEVPFTFEPRHERDVPMTGKPVGGWPFTLSLVRALVHQASLEELRAALPPQLAPHTRPSAADLVAALGLSASERRFLERLAGRDTTAALLANAGISPLAGGRVLFLLDVLGGLDWEEPADSGGADDPVEAFWARLAVGNLFDQVGGHYSTPPPRLRGAYDALLGELGPGCAAHRRSPEYAVKIVEQAKRAWAVVRNRGMRREYRNEQLRIDVRSAANVLVQEAKVALMRGHDPDAREAFAAAYDLIPHPEYLAAWRKLGANPDGTFAPEQADKLTLEEVTPVPPKKPLLGR
jgi:uncharacterized protein (TIGR02266 family)